MKSPKGKYKKIMDSVDKPCYNTKMCFHVF